MKTNRLFLHLSSKRKQKVAAAKAAAKSRKPSALAGSIAMLAASAFMLGSAPEAKAGSRFWDPFLTGTASGGGAGTWDNLTTANWWDQVGLSDVVWNNANLDIAIFGGSAGTVTLGAPITAGGLTFSTSGYDITGGTLTLAAPTGVSAPSINVAGIGARDTISAILAGTNGFIKTGDGTLVLSNSSNSYTGNTLVNQGTLVITNAAQLGGSSLIQVNGFNAVNFTGGALVFQGGTAGQTLTQNLALAGRGINYANSSNAAFVNIGLKNTLAGSIGFSNSAATGLSNTYGNLTLSGTVSLATSQSVVITGNGNIIVSGVISGSAVSTDRLVKSGIGALGSTLWLQNAGNNYVSDTRIDSGTVRVSTAAALGLVSTSTTSIDLNNGALEILTDAPDFSGRTVRVRDNTNGTIFASRALGGSGLNQTVVFGRAIANGNANLTANSRDGYAMTFGDGVNAYSTGGATNTAITSNANGLVTINAPTFYTNGDGTARTFTVTSTGDMLATGNILRSGGGDHIFTKAGSGTLTLGGTASTFTGSANVNAGTLNIGTIGALNASGPGRVVFGGGTLNYTGAGETWSKVLLLNATNNILTNGGTGGLVISSNVGNNGTGLKNLVLGGANAGTNDIQGYIVNTTVGAGVTKFDSGNWQISSPGTTAAVIGTANAAFGVTANATTSQTVTTTSTTGLVVGQPISGGAIPFGTVISQIISPTQFAISQTAVIPASVVLGTVNGATAAAATTAVSAGTTTAPTLTFASTANLVPGQVVTGTGLTGTWYISAITSATVVTLASSTGNTVVVGSIPAATSITPAVVPNFAGALTIGGGALTLNPTSATNKVVGPGNNVVFNVDPIRGNGFAGGTLNYKGFTTGSTDTAGILTATAGLGKIAVTPGTSGTTTLTFGSVGTRAAGAGLNFAPGTGTGIQFTAAPAGLNGQLGGYAYITNPATGSIDFVTTPVAVTNITALGAATTLPATVGSATTNYVVGAGGVTTTAAVAANTIRLVGGNSLTLGGNLTITSTSATALGGILHDNTTGASSITGAFGLFVSAANQELVVTTGGSTPANALTIGSVISGNNTATAGTGGLTKDGTGNLILSGVNTYTGTTTVNEGTITLSGSGTLGGVSASLVLRQNTTLDLNGVNIGASVLSGGLNNFSGAGSITNSAASGTAFIRTGNANGGGTFSGIISDGATAKVAFAKGGSGTVSLTGLNTFSGGVTITGGIVAANSLSNFGSASSIGTGITGDNAGSLVFNGGGTLQYTGSNAAIFQMTQTPSISIDRLFTMAGTGASTAAIDSSGQYGNNVLGAGAANNAALVFNNTGAVAFAGTGTRALTLQGNSTGDNEFKPVIGNNPNAGELTSLTKAGTGLWIVSGANTYGGATNITGGALQATDGVGIPTASNIVLNGGVFQSNGTSPVTFNRTLGTGSGNVSWSANGNGGFSAGSTPLTVNVAGTPTWGSTANFLGTGNLILSSTSAFADTTVSSDFNVAAGSASANITTTAASATATVTSTAGLTVGQIITGNANIPAGTFISAITNGTTITLSTATGVTAGSAVASTLSAGYRQIQVDDNGNTNLDFATITGVIGGTGGINKIGGGTLILDGNNTNSGSTYVSAGTLIVQSIGASGATSSSLGTNVGGGSLVFGFNNAAGNLMYVGTGETVTRPISLAGTTSGGSIDSSGSGPLVISTLTNDGAGAKTLTIRGSNNDANQITANLLNNGTNILTVTKADAGNWELTGTNTFTGNLNINGGLLGTNNAAALGAPGTGAIVVSNGGIYSTNPAGLTIARAMQIASNTQVTFAGAYPITVTSNIQGNTGNPWTINNDIPGATGLTISGNFNSAEVPTQARTLAIQGTGNTVLSGVIQGTGATNGGVGLIINTASTATTTLTGASPNLMSSGGELRQGILILDKAQALGLAATTFDLNGGELRTSSNVAAQTQANAFRLNSSVGWIDGANPLTMSGSLTVIGGNRTLQNDTTLNVTGPLNLSADTNARTLTLTGSGTTTLTGLITNNTTTASNFTYSGLGNLIINGAAANTWTGTAIFNSGTTTVSNGATLGTTAALTVNQAILTLDNTGTSVAGRLGANRAINLNGGTLNFLGNAAGTTEATTGILTIGSGGTTINNVNAGGNSFLTFGSLVATAAGSSINFTGGVGTATNQVIFTAAPALTPVTTGILARATVGGADFATYGANGIAAFTGYVTPTSINTPAATDTVKVDGTTTTGLLAANRTINALTFDTGAPTISTGSGNGVVLTLTSGGVLVKAGSQTLAARTNLTAEGQFHVASGATLNLSGPVTGTVGLTKNLTGALNITAPQFYTGATTLNGGTTTFSGGSNTLFPGQTLVVNPTATLDLNGNNQYVQAFGGGNNPGTGGTITSTGAAVFTNNGNVAFGGDISGAITMNKTGSSTLTAESALTYTGATYITGGTLTLRDNATLLNTSAINLNFATLNLDSNANFQIGNNNRVSDTAPITSRGGTITYQARFQAAGSETFGALSLAEGASTINVNAANNAGSNTPFLSADVTFASLTRSAGTTLNITANQGLTTSGNANRLFFTTAPATLSNGMLGAWAIANTSDFATYDKTLGAGAFGYGDFKAYDTTLASGNVTQILSNATAVTTSLSAASTITGALRLGGVTNNDITFTSASNVLNLETGGLLRSNQNAGSSIGTAASRGVLTAGGAAPVGTQELVIYSAATGTTTTAATATTVLGSNVITTVPSTAGFAPGQIVTTANLPVGTYIVSVDSPTQITVSQNATAGTATNAIVANTSSVVVNSVITDNGASPITLTKSGAGILNLSANNLYTGGSTFNQGTVNLIGSGVVIPAGGITLSGATLVMNTNAGQIDSSNAVTLNDSSTLTLLGNNSLASLAFNNSGGTGTPTVSTGGILTLTGSSPFSVVSNNVATVPIVNGTVNLTPGAKTVSVGAIQIGGQTVSTINPALNIAGTVNGIGTSLIKTGAGLLQFAGQNTFTGGIDLQNGGLLVGSSSSPAQGGAGITSGPFGSGAITAAAGTYFVTDNTRAIGNDITFAGTPTFDSTANTVWTLTLNGQLSGLASGASPVQVTNPFLTVALLGKIPNIASITSFNKTGAGTLIFNSTGYTGNYDAAALGASNAISLLHDGTSPNVGNGVVETVALGSVTFGAGTSTVTVGRAGGTLPFNLAVNKILSPSSINTVLTNGLIVANNNGYGLQVNDTGALVATPTFTVNTATASNVTQGLYLAGALSGSGFQKTGNGTLVLGNTGNTFAGTINVRAGVVSISDPAQLGNAANTLNLNPTAGSTATLRATDNITTSRSIQLGVASDIRAIEVVAGKTLQLDSALNVSVALGAALNKNDQGTLVLNANNPTWTGQVNINQGAILVNNPALTTPLGTGTIVANPAALFSSALQLAGGVTLSNPLTLQGAANFLNAGINFKGALDNVSGTNTYAGPIAHTFDSTIGARAGSTLNITGLITATGSHRLQFNAEGDINPSGGESGILFGFDKYGAGTLTISTASFGGVMTTGGVQVHQGTLVLSGAGTTNSAGAVNIVQSGAIMRLDNSGTNTNNRLTARAVTLQGGTLELIANNTTETAGALLVDQGANTINNIGSGTSALTFASLTAPSAGSSLNVTGTFGSATNFVKFTAAPALIPTTTGILNRVTVNGNELASYNTTNGIVAFTNYSPATNILTVGSTQAYRAQSGTSNSLTANMTLNALTFTDIAAPGSGATVGGLAGATETITSGTILATGTGSNTYNLNVPIVAFGSEALIHVAAGQTLNILSGMTGTAGLSKDLPGTLNLNAQQFVSGTTFVNGGTLKLGTASNTLLFNNGVVVNTGGTLDLNGGAHFIAGLSSAAAGGGAGVAGGSVINSAGSQATFTVTGNTNFEGVISGNIFLNKTGTNALNFQNAQTYTGPTLITGGTVTLNDMGALPNTSQPIDIRYGTLSLANGNLYDVGNRVSDTAPITLTGGSIAVAGRQQAASSETFGSVTLAGGHNTITTGTGGTNVNSLDVTIASLSRTDTTSTLRLNATGQLGSSARLFITAAPTLTNNIIGPWAIVDREFASYDSTYGVGALNGNGFAGYAGSGLNSGALATDNVRFTNTGTTTLLGNTTVGTLTFGQQNAATVLNLGGNTLTVQGGGLLFGQGTDNVDFSITSGNLTSGVLNSPSDFFITQANFSGTNRTVTIGAAITDNGTGAVRVIKSSGDTGASVMTWNGTNSYTGGTVLNQGTLVLGATGTMGTGGITVNQAAFTQTAGGVIPSQALVMNGNSTVTLAGNNSLTNLTINNNGGAAPTLNPTGVLTLTGGGGITATTSSPGTIATITTGTLDLNGAASYPISVGAAVVNSVDTAPWQAGLNIVSNIQNGGINKTGAGNLGLAGSGSTFTGGVNITSGGLVLGTNSTPSTFSGTPFYLPDGVTPTGVPSTVVTSGPLGTGTLTMGANTTMAATTAVTVANGVIFQGDSVFNGTNNITFNGLSTIPAIWNATVTAPQMTVTLADVSGSLTTDVVNKAGLGTLNLGFYNGTINVAGAISFLSDGNGLGTVESVILGGALNVTSDTVLIVNRTGVNSNARNKILQKASLSDNGSILSVTNLSGYGLEITGGTSFTGASHIAVGTATASNVVQGVTLSGVVSDTAGFDLTKSGAGTLQLTNAGNTFGGAGKVIDVLNGILSVNSDGALGNAANAITLEVDSTTGTGFRSTGTFATSRTFNLNAANNAFEVTQGNTLTLNTAFNLSAVSNTLTKNDSGILAINASNATLTGAITINGGAIQVQNSNAIGSGAITVNNAIGSALQLSGGVTISNAITLNGNSQAGGINSGGHIESVSGVNTYAGLITQAAATAVTYGADAGATLNINGGIATANTSAFVTGAGGTINLNSVLGNGGAGGALTKFGQGTLNVTVNLPAYTGAITVNAGTMNVSGAGVTLGTAGLVSVNAGGTLTIDDTATTALRLGNRAVTIQGGTLNYIGNASTETSTGALTFAREGGTYNQTGTGTVTFASLGLGGDASANFAAGIGTGTNKLLFTAAPTLSPVTTGILARATVGGSTFATYGANGIAGFTAYNASVNINTPAATDTVDITPAMTTTALTATKTVNALRFSNAAGTNISGAPFSQLVLTSGGILATGGGTNTLSVPVWNNAAVQNVVQVDAGTTLNVTSHIVSTGGTVKDGTGTLQISTANTNAGIAGVSANTNTGVVTIARGTLQLVGGTNRLNPGQFIVMGASGATLDLNGNSQAISGLLTDIATPSTGGSVIGGAGSQLVINQDNTTRTYAGTIGGSVNLVRSGQNTLTLASSNGYTGTTLINGGATTLASDGALTATASIDLNYATLTLDDSQITASTNRINDAAGITLRGGTLAYQGRAQTASTETLGAVTLAQGLSVISSTVGGTGINSADLTLTSLTRAAGGGTINFTAATGGLVGSSSRILIPTINGGSTATAFAGLTNGIIGGWATIGTSDFATYVPGLGVAALGTAGAPQYSNATTTAATLNLAGVTDNIALNTAVGNIPVTNDLTINSLKFGNVGTNTVNIAATKTLTIGTGGLLFFSTAVQNVGSAVNQGNLTSGGSELFVYTQGTGPHVINSVITGAGVTLIKSGSGQLNLAGTNTYGGGTTVNQGILNVLTTGNIPLATTAANGLVINNATVTLNAAGSIASGNIITINGAGSILNLFGNNTVEGLVLNNNGGGSGNLQINTFAQPATGGSGATGVLTIGNSGIVATSSNIASTTIIVGRTDFGATAKTIDVAPISANGVDLIPLQNALALQGIVGTAGGINKVGNGVLQFNAQAQYTGPTNVTAGGIRIGVSNGGSRNSALTLGAGTNLNLAGTNTTFGSLAGSGTVFSSGAANTLTVGFDNTSTSFGGQLSRFNDAVINGVALQKIGTGTLSMTSAQAFATGTTGTITVNGGGLTYVDNGAAFPGTAASGATTITVNNGGTLALDNTGAANVNNRLGLNATGTLNIQGGKLTINTSSTAATPVTEGVTTFNVTNGGGRVELTADPANPLTLAITTLGGANASGTLVIGGITGAASANGVARVTITTPTLIAGQGTGVNGTVTMGVRGDILADASVSGLGTGFLVKDSVTNNYRALAAGELLSAIALPLATDVDPITAGNQTAGTANVGLTGATQGLTINSIANTLTISGTSTVNSGLGAAFGVFGPTGNLLGLTLSNAAASLTIAGATGNINTAFGNTTAGTTIVAHVVAGGTLNVNGAFGLTGTASNTGGFMKADGGLLSLNNLAYYTGATTVNDGTLKLNSGSANTIAVLATSGAASASNLAINGTGATVDLNGQNQTVGTLSSVNPLPGQSGTVTSAAAATLTSIAGGTFAGNIGGALSFTRAGNSTTLLTSANGYSGATVIRGGVLQLRDSGSILSTSSITVNYGTLNNDNFGLNASGTPNPTRISATTPITLQGGTLTLNGAGSTDNTLTVNSLTVTGGNNTVNVLPQINEGSTGLITIGALNRTNTNHSGVNFNGFTTNNSSGTSTTGGQGLTANGNINVGALNFTLSGAVTTAASSTVTVPSTAGLLVGALVTGTGLPANERVTAITGPTTFTVTTGTGVTAQASTNLATTTPITNLAITNGATTAASNIVTVPSTAGLTIGLQVTGTGLPANEFITAINIDGIHFTVTTGTGVTAQAATTVTASNLTNNLIGGWAVADGSTFATYVTGFGVSVMGQTTQGIVAPGFTGTDVSAALVATGNYNDGTTARSLAAGAVVSNSWRFGPTAAQTITFPTTTTATLGVGIITNSTSSTTLAATDATNTLTSSSKDLYFYANQSTLAIQPAIVGAISVITNGPNTVSLRPTFANNTYTGGTFANAGTLNLSAATGFIAIPGDLTVNNATVSMSTVPNQIATTSNLFINAGSVTLANYATGPTQTLNSVTFTNEGATANPTLSLGTPTVAVSTLILSAPTPITSTSNSNAFTPTISTGAAALTALQFSDPNPVIQVNDGLAETELTISAPITQHTSMTTLTKSGTGALVLSGASTFTTGLTLSQGSLVLGASSTPATANATVTSGPLGTGTLVIAGGTTILSDNTVRTVSNNVTVNGDFTFGGRVAGANVNLFGIVSLGSAGRTITVTSPAVTDTLGGGVTSTATSGFAFTKAGAGTLVLNQNAATNLNGLGVAVTGGILKGAIADNALPVTAGVTISAGAGYDLNNFNQTLDSINGAGFITQSGAATKTLTVSSTVNNSTFSGILADNVLGNAASHLALTKIGTPTTVTLTGANTYTGATAVTSGILSIGNNTGLGTTAAGTTVASGGSLELQGNITVGAETLSITGTGSTGANGALRNLSGSNSYGGTVTVTGGSALIQSDAGLLTLNAANAVTGAAQSITVGGAGNTTISGTVTTTTGTVTKNDGGTLILSGTNTYTGVTTINSGTLAVANGLAIANTGAVVVSSVGAATFRLDNSETIGNISGGAVGGVINLQANTLTTGDASSTSFSGAIIGANGSLTKVGAGNFTLDGTAANTYTGLTTVSNGTLTLNKTGVNAIAGPGAAVKAAPAAILVNGGTLTWAANDQIGDNTRIDITSGSVLFNAFNETFFDLVNSGGSVDYGTGSVTILDPTWNSGTNTISGTTTFGVLNILGGTNTVNAGATLTVGSAGGLNFQGTGSPDITITSSAGTAGLMKLLGDVTVDSTVTAATITNGAGGANPGQVDLNGAARTFTVNNAGAGLNVGAQIIGGAGFGLTKAGTGTMTVTADNTYAGPTAVTGGTLAVTGKLSGTASVDVRGGGTLLLQGGNNIVGSGAATVDGGAQTFNGGSASYGSGANVSLGTVSTTGTLAVATGAGGNGTTHTFGTLTLNGNAILDFSSGGGSNANVNLLFSGALVQNSNTLTINGWNPGSSAYGPGATTDVGTFGDNQDRLLFTSSLGFGQGTLLSGISFNITGMGTVGAQEVQFGSNFEIVPVPEPATTALIGSVALCALIGYRERRRFTGIRNRLAGK